MQLHLNARVVSISFDPSSHQPSVKLADGAELTADVVIGADGVKSTLRELVVGHPDKPVPTGDAAYRSIIKAEDMLKDSLLKELIEFPEMMGWIGPYVPSLPSFVHEIED
jgi:salicylate hydroxylase